MGQVAYEWDVEEVVTNDTPDAEAGEIVNHNHDTLVNCLQLLRDGTGSPDTHYALVLVRDEFSQNDSNNLEYRLWAYVTDGKLPEFFQDEREHETMTKVPKRFHEQLKPHQWVLATDSPIWKE